MPETAFVRPGLDRVLCAVGIGPGPGEAVHQAISLCGDGASLRLLAACREGRDDLANPRDLSEMQARGALALALASARAAGVDPTISLRRGLPVDEVLIAEAAGYDLLVLAARTWLGRQVDVIDPIAMRIAALAPCPVLLARGSHRTQDGLLRIRMVESAPGLGGTAERIGHAALEVTTSLLVRRAEAAAAEKEPGEVATPMPALAAA